MWSASFTDMQICSASATIGAALAPNPEKAHRAGAAEAVLREGVVPEVSERPKIAAQSAAS